MRDWCNQSVTDEIKKIDNSIKGLIVLARNANVSPETVLNTYALLLERKNYLTKLSKESKKSDSVDENCE